MTNLEIEKLKEQLIAIQRQNESLNEEISERKQAEAALRESEERFRRMFFHSPDAIAISRMEDGLFVEVNDRFTEVTGYTREETIGKTSLELNILSNPEDRKRLIDALKTNGTVPNFEALFRLKNGELVFGLTSATIIPINGIPHILTTHRLIGDIKKIEQELREQTGHLETINDLARKAAGSLDTEAVISATLDSVMAIMGPSVVLIFLRRDEELHLRGSRVTNEKYAHDPAHLHQVGHCLCGLAAKDGLSIFSTDIQKDPRCTWNECKLAGLKSFAAVPLLVHNEVIGVMSLGSDTPRDFEPQMQFLESMAATTALSLQNALLYEKLRDRSKLLEEEVAKRTAALEKKNEELQKANTTLERMNKLFVGRELRIKELKEEVKRLKG